MKVITGNLEVYKSGIVRTGFTNSIKFDFDHIWIAFNFITNGTEYRSEYTPADDSKGLNINIYNSNSALGAGVTQPIRIGIFEGRELWVAYRTFKPFSENNSWTLEYVFYLGENVDEQN